MTGQREQCLFFVSVPDMSKLCSVFLSFQSCSDEGELRNKQIKTCRELLLLCSEAVASPVLGFCGGIRVIMAIPFLKRGFIQAYAQRHCLQLGPPKRVLPETLQTCLSYSITARLAPSWNRAGQCLIAGEDFLSCAGKQIAVVLELNVNEAQLCVSVEAITVRLPPTLLEDFDVPPLVVKNFLSSREAVVHTKPNNWCYILPSMKKGQLISISRKIPPESPFHSYTELQKHWTSMYGYQLPPLNEDEVVYCSVYFKLVGEKLFTYPLSCIRTKPLQLFPRVDLQGALEAFTSDLRRVLDNICGFPVQMTNKPQYHTAELSRPVIQASRALPANLTTITSTRPVLTQIPSCCAPGRVPLSQLTPSQWPLSQPGRLSNINQTATTKELASFQTPRPSAESPHFYVTETHKFPSSCTSLPPLSSSSCPGTIHSLSTQSQPVHQTPKLVPIFKNKSLSRHVNITKILAEKQQKQVQLESQHISGAAVKRPHCSYSYSPPSSSTLVTSTQSLSQPPLKRVTLPFRKNQKSNHGASVPAPQQPAFKPQPLIMPEVTSNRGGEVFESHPKRPRVTLQDADVVKYAKSNQLAKISMANLQAWLKGRGVIVRAKEKKEELVSKVMQCLYEP
ncbi:hypothetical protein AMEX_G9068 [Astyanax mexicanus]|uniref:DUF4708 domain-containing protein n=1 Tax=Astyanax mexicanus TaxID=7994 RepID=A0A8B9KKK7_ASTMX|nr:hypothetical protein AMEX_G9068 [Astyanax mexicanus]